MGITSLPPTSTPTGGSGGGGIVVVGGEGSTAGPIYSTFNSVPTGVESVYQYNGLTLNDLSVYDRYRITRIEGLGDADVRDQRELHPARHGEEALLALYGGRPVVLQGRIESWTLNKMRDMVMALKQAFSPLVESDLVVVTGRGFARDHLIRCRKVQPIAMTEEQKDFNFWREFMITLRASNPRILSREQITSSTSVSGSATGDSILEIVNNGNFNSEPKIVLRGPMTNPQIAVQQWEGGAAFRLAVSMAAGEERWIDTATRRIYDASGTSRFGEYVLGSSWPELPPGSNNINFWATELSGSSSVTVYHQHSWI